VQAGIFAVTENAERLVARFRAAGFPAEGKPMTYRGAPAIRVVAGPFETEAALADALRTLRRIGPSDAVPVRK
jgi:cell division protein FtsN